MEIRSQTKLIEEVIMAAVNRGIYKNKHEIMNAVVDELGVPRPTVRRVKANLVKKMKQQVKVLE